MAGFEKLTDQILAQRAAKAEAVELRSQAISPASEPKPKATRKRRQVADSKRANWLMRAWYVQPDTASRLRAYVNRQQEAGETIDASEIVDTALRAWLQRKGG
jgi:hypothetical protein